MTETATDTVSPPKPRTLHSAREEFIRVMNEDTAGAERTRLLAVLDALIAWSTARSGQLRFRVDERKSTVITYEWTKTKETFWSAQTTRGNAPRLSLVPRAAHLLTAEQRQVALDTLNAHTRDQLEVGDPLRIGFGALKNDAARGALLDLFQQLLTPPS